MSTLINQFSTSGLAQRTNTHAAATMLTHAMPILVLGNLGKMEDMPKNKGESITFRRRVPFSAVSTPLAEGVTPPPTALRYEDVPGTLQEFGEYVPLTNKGTELHEDKLIEDAAMLCGENIGRTWEHQMWAVLRAGTGVSYAGSAVARNQVNTAISINDQRGVVRSLDEQKARHITEAVAPSPLYKSTPVEGAYVAVAHTKLKHDLRRMPGFEPCSSYSADRKRFPHEFGTVDEVRYVLSPDLDPFLAAGSSTLNGMVSAGGSAVDVYPVIYFGKEAFAQVKLRGYGSVTPKIRPPGEATDTDPLGQRGSVGWRSWFLCLRLNENWMHRLEVGVSDL